MEQMSGCACYIPKTLPMWPKRFVTMGKVMFIHKFEHTSKTNFYNFMNTYI